MRRGLDSAYEHVGCDSRFEAFGCVQGELIRHASDVIKCDEVYGVFVFKVAPWNLAGVVDEVVVKELHN